jgi:hypothetical protein
MTTLAERFDAKVDRSAGPEGCWPWTGCTTAGYGQIWRDGRMDLAHRVAYELATGTDPAGRQVLHACDNPPCVNHAHLSLGSHADNMADRDAKDRTRRGERTTAAKLTEADVVEMRRLRAGEGLTYAVLGARFGVSSVAARRACSGQSWAHLDIWGGLSEKERRARRRLRALGIEAA